MKEGGGDASIKYGVSVGAGQGVASGIEVRRWLVGLSDLYVPGEMVIQSLGPGIFRQTGIGLEVDHLTKGVDACIGAAGPSYAHLLARDFGNGFFQLVLYGREIGLILKAFVFATVVLNNEGQLVGRLSFWEQCMALRRGLDEFQLGEGGGVALSLTQLGDACVTAGAVGIAGCKVVEYLLDHGLVGNLCCGQPPVV